MNGSYLADMLLIGAEKGGISVCVAYLETCIHHGASSTAYKFGEYYNVT